MGKQLNLNDKEANENLFYVSKQNDYQVHNNQRKQTAQMGFQTTPLTANFGLQTSWNISKNKIIETGFQESAPA